MPPPNYKTLARISSEVESLLARLENEAAKKASLRSDQIFQELWCRAVAMDDLRRSIIHRMHHEDQQEARVIAGFAGMRVSAVNQILDQVVD